MCTFDHVGIYVTSVPCVTEVHKYRHDQMYTWNRSYINTDMIKCTFDHVGIYVTSVHVYI